jgi:hypothetical protein
MFILGFFPKCIREVVNLYESLNDLGRVGKTLFIIMGITKKNCNLLHLDKNDSMSSYILWFHENELSKTTKLISYESIR